jgi:Uma2 family endonuclease
MPRVTTAASKLTPVPRPDLAAIAAGGSLVPITVEQYHRMVEQGIVLEDGTVELLRGALVRKDRSSPGEDPMGHSPLHKLVVASLTALAGRINQSGACHLQIQLPVSCPPDGEPEPDASIVRGGPRDYVDRLPGAADVSCVIEVAHSSVQRDREVKLPIYASAGIGQYVLINLETRTIEVYSAPDRSDEQYRSKATLDRTQSLSLWLPQGGEFTFAIAEILP